MLVMCWFVGVCLSVLCGGCNSIFVLGNASSRWDKSIELKPFGYDLSKLETRMTELSGSCWKSNIGPVQIEYTEDNAIPKEFQTLGLYEWSPTEDKAQNTACWAFTAARVANRILVPNKKKPVKTKIDCSVWHEAANAKFLRLFNKWKGGKSTMYSNGETALTKADQSVAADIGWNQMSFYGYPAGVLDKETITHESFVAKPLFGLRTGYVDGKFVLTGACLKVKLNKRNVDDKKFILQFIKQQILSATQRFGLAIGIKHHSHNHGHTDVDSPELKLDLVSEAFHYVPGWVQEVNKNPSICIHDGYKRFKGKVTGVWCDVQEDVCGHKDSFKGAGMLGGGAFLGCEGSDKLEPSSGATGTELNKDSAYTLSHVYPHHNFDRVYVCSSMSRHIQSAFSKTLNADKDKTFEKFFKLIDDETDAGEGGGGSAFKDIRTEDQETEDKEESIISQQQPDVGPSGEETTSNMINDLFDESMLVSSNFRVAIKALKETSSCQDYIVAAAKFLISRPNHDNMFKSQSVEWTERKQFLHDSDEIKFAKCSANGYQVAWDCKHKDFVTMMKCVTDTYSTGTRTDKGNSLF